MDRKLLDIVACPICKKKLTYLKQRSSLLCPVDRIAYPIRDEIPILIESEGVRLTLEEMDAIKR